jgi:hypothetical protein
VVTLVNQEFEVKTEQPVKQVLMAHKVIKATPVSADNQVPEVLSAFPVNGVGTELPVRTVHPVDQDEHLTVKTAHQVNLVQVVQPVQMVYQVYQVPPFQVKLVTLDDQVNAVLEVQQVHQVHQPSKEFQVKTAFQANKVKLASSALPVT